MYMTAYFPDLVLVDIAIKSDGVKLVLWGQTSVKWCGHFCFPHGYVADSSMVDRVSEPLSGQTKYYKIGNYCFSAKHVEVRTKTCWLEFGIMCPSGAICILVDCCFNELTLCKSNQACWSSTEWPSSYWNVICNRHHIAENVTLVITQLLTHSFTV